MSGRFSDMLARRQIWSLTVVSLFGPPNKTVMGVFTALVILVGARMALSGQILVADLVAFILYNGSLFQPLFALGNAVKSCRRGTASLTRVTNILDTRQNVKDTLDAASLGRATCATGLSNVGVAYRAATHALHDISPEVAPAHTLALAGPTSVGTSTIAHPPRPVPRCD
ncbi:MAG: ABC transporter ATP-binding protein [Pseudomonadota bacterium]